MYKVVWEYLHTHKHTHTQHINEREILWSETKQVTQLLWDEIVKVLDVTTLWISLCLKMRKKPSSERTLMCDKDANQYSSENSGFFWIQLQEEITKGIII